MFFEEFVYFMYIVKYMCAVLCTIISSYTFDLGSTVIAYAWLIDILICIFYLFCDLSILLMFWKFYFYYFSKNKVFVSLIFSIDLKMFFPLCWFLLFVTSFLLIAWVNFHLLLLDSWVKSLHYWLRMFSLFSCRQLML